MAEARSHITIAKRPSQGQYRLYEAATEDEHAYWLPLTAQDLLDIMDWALRKAEQLRQEAGVQDEELALMLASATAFYSALDTLRGIETSEIMIPGPHEQWEQALRVAYRASSDIDERLDSWQDELEIHYEREGQAEDSL